ncbi:kinase [Siccirubricoccus phaeus]|uniref:kinase n=1 Tax=Siccirubricoccus phaeus TaxID=2595053 RepID=UPI001A9C5BE8|nr:kinase [Siccirubricoccus phaeus]
MWLRTDAIEQAMRQRGVPTAQIGPAGHTVAQAVAATNLALGRDVVADAVSPAAARAAWRALAAEAGAALPEVVCSDLAEHRCQVESRQADIPGLALPDWAGVTGRRYEPWTAPHLVLDSARLAAALAWLEAEIAGRGA